MCAHILESGDGGPMELMKEFRMHLDDKKYSYSPPKETCTNSPKERPCSTSLFSYTPIWVADCTGGKVNGKNQTIRYKLQSGDTIEILTSPTQKPKREWLSIACTSKARVKIKQTLNEIQHKEAELGKELLVRRFKNRKVDVNDSILMKLIRKTGYKTVTDFYCALSQEKIDVNHILDLYHEIERKESEESSENRTAENFVAIQSPNGDFGEDELVIDQNIKGLDYKLSKCCNPIFGDKIFGFVSSQGSIKIHREDCPNAENLRTQFGYRIVKARWSGKQGSQYAIVLRVTILAIDDIGICYQHSPLSSQKRNAYRCGAYPSTPTTDCFKATSPSSSTIQPHSTR